MKAHQLILLLTCLLFLSCREPAAERLTLYVATNGNDAWSGNFSAANRARTDGPLASLAGARDAIRRLRAAQGPLGPVRVQVRGGTYRLIAPFILEPQDSGTVEALVSFEAYPGEHPVLSGANVISGFHQQGARWETLVPEAKSNQWHFEQLFVDGQRRQIARSPNHGYYRIAKLIPGPPTPKAKPFARDQFVFAPGEIKPWERLSDARLILMHSWETSIHPLRSVDPISDIVHFAPIKEWWGIGYWEEAQRYYVENALELLDEPGEWYLNRQTSVLTYWPLPNENINRTEVLAPRLTELVRFAGKPDANQFVQYVRIKGLAFHHADWVLDPQGNSSTQAAVEVPAAVTADGALHCSFENCEIAHVGTYGIWFRRGCKDCRIQHNRLFDLGAGGIRVGEANRAPTDVAETTHTLVDNNHIFDGGHVYPAGIGVWLAQSSSNVISHNDIHDLLYSGMSIGWNWDDAPNRTHHNVVEFNHVHNLGHGVLSDSGLIYCLGVSPGSIIRNNVFHDNWPYAQPPLGWGIYLDGTCGNYLVESNLVYNTLSGGLMFNNGGHEHVIRNNIFGPSINYSIWPYFERRPNAFRRNIVLLTQGELFVPNGEPSLNDRLAARQSLGDWDLNIYWHIAGPDHLRFFHRTFPEWKELYMDRHSLIAVPGFINPAVADFRLSANSPARQLGFQPVDTSKVGLYGDRAWANQVQHANCIGGKKMLPAITGGGSH